MQTVPGKITLEDGTVFNGRLWNFRLGTEIAEIVFNTSMTGYQEVITDPSYANQFIVMTYPLIGNYGVNAHDEEAKNIFAKGLVAKEFCTSPESYTLKHSLLDYLEQKNMMAIDHIDTRALTIILRDKGTMKAAISKLEVSTSEIMQKIKSADLSGTTKIVSTPQPYTLTPPYGNVNFRVALLDFGVKKNIIDSLLQRQCQVTVLPYHSTFEQIKAVKPHGILLSNGPGDPKEHLDKITLIKKIIDTYPTFGICMGHQILSLALGADTTKMKFGHRGANHPVLDKKNQRMYMTSQNHGYMTIKNSFTDQKIHVRFTHNNDDSVEGFEHLEKPLLSVQFHPEAHPGPADSGCLFDEFIKLMDKQL